jgi:hypothetical protein
LPEGQADGSLDAMKPLLPFLLFAAPGLADVGLASADCPPDAQSCFAVTGLALSPGRPAMVGQGLVLVGQGDGDTGMPNALLAVRIDLGGPRVAGSVVLDATASERLGLVEVAPDGGTYAVFAQDERDHRNRNRLTPVVQFFDDGGQRLGRMSPPHPPSWPDALEWSPVDLLRGFAGTNALRFSDDRMALQFGPHALSVSFADGALTLASGPGTDLEERVDNLLVGGGDSIWVTPGLTAHATWAVDGAPATLRLSRTAMRRAHDALAHAETTPLELEPNDSDYSRNYSSLALSPDGTRLAALRLADTLCDAPVAYRLVVYDTASGNLIWTTQGMRSTPAQQHVTWTPDNRLILTEARGTVDAPCGPAQDAPAIAVTMFAPPLPAP